MVYLVFVPKNILNDKLQYKEFDSYLSKYCNYTNSEKRYLIKTESYEGDDNESGYSNIYVEMGRIDLNYLDPYIDNINPKDLDIDENICEFKSSRIDLIPRFGAFIVEAVSLKDRGIDSNYLDLNTWGLKTFLSKMDFSKKSSQVVLDTLDELELTLSSKCSYIYDDFHDKLYDTEKLFNILFDIESGSIIRKEDKITMFSEDYEDFMDIYKDIKIFN